MYGKSTYLYDSFVWLGAIVVLMQAVAWPLRLRSQRRVTRTIGSALLWASLCIGLGPLGVAGQVSDPTLNSDDKAVPLWLSGPYLIFCIVLPLVIFCLKLGQDFKTSAEA